MNIPVMMGASLDSASRGWGVGVSKVVEWTEGILDNVSIRGAIDFAARWHQREWSIVALPLVLDVRLTCRDVPPEAFGLSIVTKTRRVIALNERIVDTPAHIATLAHECGHLFQAPGIGLCRSTVALSRREREAWWIASVLAVPLDLVRSLRLWDDDPRSIARTLALPHQMVAMRKALALIFGELPPELRSYPDTALNLATAGMQARINRFSQQLADRAL